MSSSTSTLTIGELAQRTGVSPSAIRYYERMGVLPPPARVSGRRAYETDALARLKVLTLAKRAGLPLSAIRTLFDADSPGPAWRQAALRRRTELDVQARVIARQRALLARVERCRCANVDACADEFLGC